jgi:hypothetical protein
MILLGIMALASWPIIGGLIEEPPPGRFFI